MLKMTDEMAINFESLTFGLKAAQNARSCLEKDLAQKRRSRNQIEKTLEVVNGKLNQTKDVHAKMQETMKIAQHKVVQTQTLSESLESANESKRLNLAKLGEQIQIEEEGRETDIMKFEEELSSLSQLMRGAKNLYNDEKLDKDYDQSVSSEKELEKLGRIYEEKISELERNLEVLLEHDPAETVEDEKIYAVLIIGAEKFCRAHGLGLHETLKVTDLFETAEKESAAYLKHLDTILGKTYSPSKEHDVMD